MDNVQGKFELVNGSGKIAVKNGEFLPLMTGKAIELFHPEFGWIQAIYAGNGEAIHSRGTYQLEPGETVKVHESPYAFAREYTDDY
ncbi:hypothetical protein [Aneurinibacillus tyrosinisolvens]|uniref:hypothetical protein n=1 Tax=Aneurinibacillus tyrosinisolvens TaxID=1443435 RepID=UPI00063F7070|nr:hypothetical protein [Aneurinibacillus tyrosinisolvens]